MATALGAELQRQLRTGADEASLREELGRVSRVLGGRGKRRDSTKARHNVDATPNLLEALIDVLCEADAPETLEATEEVLYALRDSPQLALSLELQALAFARLAVRQRDDWRQHRAAAVLLGVLVDLRDPELATEILAEIADAPAGKAGTAVAFAASQIAGMLAPEDLVRGHTADLLDGVLQASLRAPAAFHGVGLFAAIVHHASFLAVDDLVAAESEDDAHRPSEDESQDWRVVDLMTRWVELALEWVAAADPSLPVLVYERVADFFSCDLGSSSLPVIARLQAAAAHIALGNLRRALEHNDPEAASENSLIVSSSGIIFCEPDSTTSLTLQLLERATEDERWSRAAFVHAAAAARRIIAAEDLAPDEYFVLCAWHPAAYFADAKDGEARVAALGLCAAIIRNESILYKLDPPVAAVANRVFRSILDSVDGDAEASAQGSATAGDSHPAYYQLAFQVLSQAVAVHSRELSPAQEMVSFLQARLQEQDDAVVLLGLEWVLALLMHGAMTNQDKNRLAQFLRSVVHSNTATEKVQREAALLVIDLRLLHNVHVLHDLERLREILGSDEEAILTNMSRQEVDVLLEQASPQRKLLHSHQTDADARATCTFPCTRATNSSDATQDRL